jgi:very-short-patch-repair endonuclease
MSLLEDRFATAWAVRYPELPFQREVVIPPWEAWSHERKLLGLAKRRQAYRADFVWPEARVAVEIQGAIWKGGAHSTGSGVNRDCAKTLVAQCGGWAVLPLTDRMIIPQQLIWLPRIAQLITDRIHGASR